MTLRLLVVAVASLALAGPGTAAPRKGCGTAPASATVAYVKDGRAWALDEATGRARCLFAAPRPGPFLWGPRGDRALLAHLEVRSLNGAPHRPWARIGSPSASWGRPVGKSVVFVGRGGRALLKLHPGGGRFHDVTPVPNATYKRVAYHPSGLALGFVLRRGAHESLWISSNTGRAPKQLVHGRFHTAFEGLAFGANGDTVFFAARHVDGHVDLHELPLVGANSAPAVWKGKPGEHVYGISVGGLPRVALTVGRSCTSRRVVVVGARPSEIRVADGPARAVGWYGPGRLLVAAGGCGRPLDLYGYDVERRRTRLLAAGVEAAASRLPEQVPTPPLPKKGVPSSFA